MGFSRLQLFKALAAIIGAVAIVSLALIHLFPAPPSKVVMATAFKGASFEYYGRQYREIFARYRVDLELRETAGAVENVKLLQDPKRSNRIYDRRRFRCETRARYTFTGNRLQPAILDILFLERAA